MSACGMSDCQQDEAHFCRLRSGRLGYPTFGLDVNDAKLVAAEITDRRYMLYTLSFRGVYHQQAADIVVHANSVQVGVNNSFLGVSGGTLLASYVARITGLRVLQLSGNGIYSEGLQAIASMLKVHPGLTEIDISNNRVLKNAANQFDSLGLVSLFSALKSNEVLRSLDICKNGLATAQIGHFQALCSSKALDLKA
jgi:hypothetical protein